MFQKLRRDKKKIEKIPVPEEIFSNLKNNGTKIIISDFFSSNFLKQLNNLENSIYNNFKPIITKEKTDESSEKIKINLIIDGKNIDIFPDKSNFELLDRFINIKNFDNKEKIVLNPKLEKDNKSSPDYDPNDLENKKERILKNAEQLDLNIECKIKLKNNELTEGKIEINSGWIGTYSTIEEKNDINNKNYGVRIYAHNRLVVKDIREKFKIDRFYISYVCGELYIDDLDSDNYKDITRLSRDSYGVQDERFQKVVEWTKKYVKILIKEKSKISQKSKKKFDNIMSENMKTFLTEAEKKLNLKSDIVKKFSHEAIEKFRIKPADDKKIIFISHVWPKNKKAIM